jgi:nitroreductase
MLNCHDTILQRRSIRKFKERPVPEEYIEIMLEAARQAPSGTNRQPWRFVIIREEEKEAIAPAVVQPFVLQAPVVFICCLDHKAYIRELTEQRLLELVEARVVDKKAAEVIYNRKIPAAVDDVILPPSAFIDLGIAVEHMVLTATALGLGSCWVRLVDTTMLHRLLSLPDNIEVVALLPVGFPDQSPRPRPRLNRNDIIIQAKINNQ